jgi:DNA invertase Pin-like site-specific DNA recombinase
LCILIADAHRPLQSVHLGLTMGIVNDTEQGSETIVNTFTEKGDVHPSRRPPTKRTRAKKVPLSISSARREGHLIGYARVSTTGQDTATQEAKLKAAGCTLIRTETVSGGSRDGRDELASILDFIRPGDVLIVVELDRLGRNTRDVLNLVHELEEKGASLRVLEPAIDTGGPMGRLVLTVLGMVAEMELGFIRDRQRAGIEAAKAKGIYKGRPVTFDRARIVSLRKQGMGATEIAKPSGASGETCTRRSRPQG